jgi:FKBP12-rapamycin complex-associated protein
MIETLEPLHAAIERGSTTLNERTFLDSYSNDLTQAHECIRSFQRSRDQRELHQAWDLYHQVFKRIHAQLPNITSLELDYVSPRMKTIIFLEKKKFSISIFFFRFSNTLS